MVCSLIINIKKYSNTSNKAAENYWDMNDMKIWDIWLKHWSFITKIWKYVNVGEPVIYHQENNAWYVSKQLRKQNYGFFYIYIYIYIYIYQISVCVCVWECVFNIFIFTIHKYFKKINSKGLLEVAIENWLKWDLNPQPLNSMQLLQQTAPWGHKFNFHSELNLPTVYSCSLYI